MKVRKKEEYMNSREYLVNDIKALKKSVVKNTGKLVGGAVLTGAFAITTCYFGKIIGDDLAYNELITIRNLNAYHFEIFAFGGSLVLTGLSGALSLYSGKKLLTDAKKLSKCQKELKNQH